MTATLVAPPSLLRQANCPMHCDCWGQPHGHSQKDSLRRDALLTRETTKLCSPLKNGWPTSYSEPYKPVSQGRPFGVSISISSPGPAPRTHPQRPLPLKRPAVCCGGSWAPEVANTTGIRPPGARRPPRTRCARLRSDAGEKENVDDLRNEMVGRLMKLLTHVTAHNEDVYMVYGFLKTHMR